MLDIVLKIVLHVRKKAKIQMTKNAILVMKVFILKKILKIVINIKMKEIIIMKLQKFLLNVIKIVNHVTMVLMVIFKIAYLARNIIFYIIIQIV
jgi:hypothetical protein